MTCNPKRIDQKVVDLGCGGSSAVRSQKTQSEMDNREGVDGRWAVPCWCWQSWYL